MAATTPPDGADAPPRARGWRIAEWTGWMALAGVGLGLWAFPDAISRLRQASAPYAAAPAGCDAATAPCTATLAGVPYTLRVRPDGAPSSSELTFDVQTPAGTRFPPDGFPTDVPTNVPPDEPPGTGGAAAPTAVELSGVDMNMGVVQLPLRPVGPGHWQAVGRLPACTLEAMRWRADVVFADRAAGFELVSVRVGPPPGAGK